MRIDIPDHRLREIAATVADRQRRHERAHAARDYRTMADHDTYLAGVALVTGEMTPRQRAAFAAMVAAATPEGDDGR